MKNVGYRLYLYWILKFKKRFGGFVNEAKIRSRLKFEMSELQPPQAGFEINEHSQRTRGLC